MKFTDRKIHMIDFIFPLILLLVFAVSALVVTLFAANVYEGTATGTARNDSARTSLSYVTEKVHGADEGGNVEIAGFDGHDALIVTSEINGEQYKTFIYSDQGKLKEFTAKSGDSFDASSGTAVMDVKDFQMEEISDGLFSFSCIDDAGKTVHATVGLRSK